jgi:hypothetical protein
MLEKNLKRSEKSARGTESSDICFSFPVMDGFELLKGRTDKRKDRRMK